MLTHFPQAVPEIPVSNVDTAADYYVNVLRFSFDWGNDEGGISRELTARVEGGGRADCRQSARTALL